MLAGRQYRELRAAFSEMNEVDVAQFIETLDDALATVAFRTLPKDAEMDVFAELDIETQQNIIASITDQEVSSLIEDLMVDDAVSMLGEMPAHLVKRVLKNSSPETRQLINEFLRYPEYSAGSIMTAEFTELKKTMTVEDAIKRIRRIGEDRETIYTCYVMDDTRHLEGVVTVKDLLLAQDGELVADLMEPDIKSVQTSDDQEDAAKMLVKYDLMSLPVVDDENRLVGIVTVDDALDVLQEEDTEDFEKMAAITPSERPYLKTSVFTLARNRLPWLLILMISGMFTGGILGHYEAMYVDIPVLYTFITMLNGTGGNAGSQSSTMIIRGMALGEIKAGDILLVAFKEARVGMVVGLGLGIVNWLRMLVTNPGQQLVALVVSLSLVAAVFIAKLIGGVLPMVAQKLKLDPALMAAPLITTIVDALVLVIYFNIARVFLF
ncbi:magnesium transporter [Ruminococcaceae bacterium OttesenSCG-928-D13]|nr:magnesium transporter [Ruminococcaceae bacterium OttesenSCG-928-D13]